MQCRNFPGLIKYWRDKPNTPATPVGTPWCFARRAFRFARRSGGRWLDVDRSRLLGGPDSARPIAQHVMRRCEVAHCRCTVEQAFQCLSSLRANLLPKPSGLARAPSRRQCAAESRRPGRASAPAGPPCASMRAALPCIAVSKACWASRNLLTAMHAQPRVNANRRYPGAQRMALRNGEMAVSMSQEVV